MFKCFTAIFHHVFWLKHQIGQHIFVPLLAHPLQVEDGSEWQGVRETGTTCMFHNCPTSLSVCTAFFILDGFWMFLIISNYTCVCMLCVCIYVYIYIYWHIISWFHVCLYLLYLYEHEIPNVSDSTWLLHVKMGMEPPSKYLVNFSFSCASWNEAPASQNYAWRDSV